METMKSTIPAEDFYLDFFGLIHNPFPVVPDDSNFFVSKHIEQILSEIVHGVLSRKGFMVLTGDIGLGKTTVSRIIMKILEEKSIETSLVFHTGYQDAELLNEINQDFGLDTSGLVFSEQSDQMKLLNDFLLEQNSQDKNCAIIIDDAQNLSFKSLEMIRMISNLETGHHKLVQILMIGQPELMNKLNSKKLRQLKSRIIIKKESLPLMEEELKNYLQFKLNSAGNSGQTDIKKNALQLIYKITDGNFRKINVLMDRCLYVSFHNNTTDITKKTVKEAYFDLEPEESRSVKTKKVNLLTVTLLFCFIAGIGCSYYFRETLSAYIGNIGYSKAQAPSLVTKPIHLEEHPAVETAPPEPLPVVQAMTAPEKMTDDALPSGKIEIPKSIAEFLGGYEFAQYDESFFKALKTRQFKDVSEAIFKETGYQLIQLQKVKPQLRKDFGILDYSAPLDDESVFFLFWQPKIKFEKYYYHYQGKEIHTLQWMLSELDLYHNILDGIVGEDLTKAIIRFQRERGLPVTGYPDDNTVFMLYHTDGEILE